MNTAWPALTRYRDPMDIHGFISGWNAHLLKRRS
jgi:hypothetical protein